MECCGAHSYQDWVYTTIAAMHKLDIPENFNPLDGPNHAIIVNMFAKQMETKYNLQGEAVENFRTYIDTLLDNNKLPNTCCVNPAGDCWSINNGTFRNQVISSNI